MRFMARELHGHVDEVVGLLITMTATPPSWQGVVLGFVLFRVFDILKPWPVGALDRRLKGGLGVMLDDVVAGVYAFAALRLLLWLWPEPRLLPWHGVALGVAIVLLGIFRKPLVRRYGKPRTRIRDVGARGD